MERVRKSAFLFSGWTEIQETCIIIALWIEIWEGCFHLGHVVKSPMEQKNRPDGKTKLYRQSAIARSWSHWARSSAPRAKMGGLSYDVIEVFYWIWGLKLSGLIGWWAFLFFQEMPNVMCHDPFISTWVFNVAMIRKSSARALSFATRFSMKI